MYFNYFQKARECIKNDDLPEARRILDELSQHELAPAAQKLLAALVNLSGGYAPTPAPKGMVIDGKRADLADSGETATAYYLKPVEPENAYFGKSKNIWNSIVQQLGENAKTSTDHEVELVTHMERYFLWDTTDSKPIKASWLGIIHNPADIPEFYDTDFSNQKLFATPLWNASKSSCMGIVTFSQYHKKLLSSLLGNEISIFVLDHPLPEPKRNWSFEKFKNNNQKKLLQLGFYLRNLHALYEFPQIPEFDKYLIRHSEMPYFKENLTLNQSHFRINNADPAPDENVKEVGFLDEKYFDVWLSENIVFLDLYTVNASSTLFACISSGTPILVNRHPVLEEYLGEDYPLFYDSKQAVPDILGDHDRIKQAHDHLLALAWRENAKLDNFIGHLAQLPLFPMYNADAPHKVTVVTVVMNMPDLLERTIKSVIAQDYQNLEYVVVDGGSTDGTVDIIKKYQQHITVWVSEPDKGIYDAMNKGGRLASGIWVNFLNAGDTFVSDSTVSDMFADVSLDDDLVYGHTIFQSDGEEKVVEAREPEHLWQAMVFNHNSLFKKCDLLLEHPFSDRYKIVADSEFIIWCYTQGKTFKNVGFPINTYESGGYADMNSVMRTVERWKVVSDYKLKPQQEINDYYFQRLLWEKPCKEYLEKVYKVKI